MHTSQRWTLKLNWSDRKSNDKEMTRLFQNKFSASDFRTEVHRFFFSTYLHLKHGLSYLDTNNLKGTKITSCLQEVWVTEGKITVNVWKKSRGNRLWFELAWGSSWRGFVLSGVNCTCINGKCIKYRDENCGRCLWGWWSPELQPSAMCNPESSIHPVGTVTLLISGT